MQWARRFRLKLVGIRIVRLREMNSSTRGSCEPHDTIKGKSFHRVKGRLHTRLNIIVT